MELKPVSISKETSRQLAVMSFICACMIVAIHCTPKPPLHSWQWWVSNLLGGDGLCRIAVPWFFVVSGFFLAGHFGEVGWYKTAVVKRIRTLLVPFVIWAIIGLLFNWLIWYGIQKTGYVCHVKNPIANGIWPALISALGFDPSRINIGPIWYLRMLFALVLVSPFIYWLTLKFRWAFPFLLLVGYGVYDYVLHFSDFWEYAISLRGIAYFSIGIALRLGIFNTILGMVGRFSCMPIMSAITLLCVNLVARFCGDVRTEYLSDFLMVPPLLIFAWRSLASVRLPAWCTTNSFAIYVMHGTFLSLSIVCVVVSGLRPHMDASIVIAALRLAFAIGVSLAVSQTVKRLSPGVARILFGGR